MADDLRYVSARTNKDGSVRIYWNRPGHRLVRLGKNWREAATELNREADGAAAIHDDTVAGVVAAYRKSDTFQARSTSTKKIYERWLREIERMWGGLHPKSITRKVAVKFIGSVAGKSSKAHAAAVLLNVLGVAYDDGLIETTDPARKFKIGKPARRDIAWSDQEIAAFVEACGSARHGKGLKVATALLLYTGQRPGDCLKMKRSDYDGRRIKVCQQKTKKRLVIRCHRELKAILDANMRDNSLFLACMDNGQPFGVGHFGAVTGRIRREIGLGHLQNRDFRQTAAVKLQEAGCTALQIGSVTGHSVKQVDTILEAHYLSPTAATADAAIELWERKDG